MKFLLNSRTTIAAIITVMFMISTNLWWNKQDWKEVVRVDAKGYYAYLPAIFIYHDLNLGFFDRIEQEKYFNANNFFDYRSRVNNRYIDKYFCGTAIVQLPFFMAGHLWCKFSGDDPDGYSRPYMIMITLAAIFWLGAGLFFLRKFLGMYGISDGNISIVLLAAVFGTNIFYYTSCEPGMSHIYSFAIFSLFIWAGKRFFRDLRMRDLFLMSIALGFLTLIRPVNLLSVLVLPFLAGTLPVLKKGIRALWGKKTWLAVSLAGLVGLLSIQLILYKIETGSFFIYSYQDDYFDFLNPHMTDILFSYRKGLFLYTPLLFISLAGGCYLLKESRFAFWSLLIFFLILTWVLSSWFLWWYGGSFGSRVYIEYIPLFALLLGLAFQKMRSSWFRKFYLGLVLLMIVVCQIQTYQYRYYKIHWSDMTKEKYWEVFLRVDQLV